jgi:hypothetical protein
MDSEWIWQQMQFINGFRSKMQENTTNDVAASNGVFSSSDRVANKWGYEIIRTSILTRSAGERNADI